MACVQSIYKFTMISLFNNRTDELVRNYGRGPRGRRIRARVPASWGPRISAFIAASQQGTQLRKTTAHIINGKRIFAFVKDQLVHILNSANGEIKIMILFFLGGGGQITNPFTA